jgi:hypothetical protein
MNDTKLQTKWKLNTFAWADESKLPGFGKLISSWLDVHRNFSEGAQPNFSWDWGYNERSQIGLLANAAMLIGGLSAVEGLIKKDSGQKEGRSDLWLRLCPPTFENDAENDYLIEAKIEQYFKIDKIDLGRAREKIDEKMKAAREEARRLTRTSEKLVAMVFLSLTFEDQNLNSLEQNISDLISDIWNQSQSQKEFDAIGAIWMGARDFKSSKAKRKEKYPQWPYAHPGMVLLASCKDLNEHSGIK